MRGRMGTQGSPVKSYDYLLKFLLVGDSDVGKGEILESLQDGASESPYAYSNGIDYKTTTILLDGRRVKLELWDTSGQGRFCTIFRSYSRGAQGILLVYDITNRWSFDGIDRWIKEIDEHAPGVPRILVGNRLHLAFKRQVPTEQARSYAEKNCMTFFEVSPLCNFNVIESFTELSRIVLMRHGMEKIWRPNRGVWPWTEGSDQSGMLSSHLRERRIFILCQANQSLHTSPWIPSGFVSFLLFLFKCFRG
ncbi:ras-related protein Rab-40C isoform X2 [Elgaria multicarinata webbii]|uniref:ras-related protein Rab-40C isoform X2 n=1 Tax=Elgaria multicarinata webbii TaxID=159646 RepID=UPI002FCCC52B